jgi:tetratricopeptide (TPR) repeat protein
VLLGKHEFARALVEAKALNQRMPDDVIVYGYMADAHVELGQYEDAEKAVQWMLDMRPGNVPALTRAAHLREIFGDVEGAIEFMQAAYQRMPDFETEERAWIATQISHLELMRGRHAPAAQIAEAALTIYPGYHYALAQLAKVHLAEKKWDAAIKLLREFYATAPHPENLYLLADSLVKANRAQEARKLFAEFEAKARNEMHSWDNANRELVFYYTNHARNPAAALEVARAETSRRQDVATLDALAWALSAAGKHVEAKATIERALSQGIRDPGMLYRAGVIAMRSGDRRGAQEMLARSLEANPRSEYAREAQATLDRLRANAKSGERIAER